MSNITISDLRKLIKEELEVVLTNDEVKEFFDVDVKEQLSEAEENQQTAALKEKIRGVLTDDTRLEPNEVDEVMLILSTIF